MDAVTFGPRSIHKSKDGARRIRYRRKKMRTRGGVLVDIPVHPELDRRLLANPEANATFLQTAGGTQRSPNGLGNQMPEWCDASSLPHCTSHGLRKACARRLAEAGATPNEIMAVTGHKTLAEVERYTQQARRAGMADNAMKLLYPHPE